MTTSPLSQGFLATLPFTIVIVPFAMLFGVLATESGLGIVETLAMSALVIAGSAQFTALQLMNEQAPVLIVLATALAVNLRMGMYSAAMVTHLGDRPLWQRAVCSYFLFDQNYAVAVQRFDTDPALDSRGKYLFFVGSACLLAPAWCGFTLVGALVGEAIPQQAGLDFALPLTFIALIAPMLKTPAHVAAAFVSVTLALVLSIVPYNLGLIVAAGAAMLTGALVEKWLEGRAS